MRYKKIQVNTKLRDFVDHYWLLEIEQEDLPFQQTLFPFGRFELFFELNGNQDIYFSGFLNQSEVITYTEPFRALGISFNVWTAGVLFDIPLSDFSGKTTNLTDLFEFKYLSAKLHNAESEREMGQILDKMIAKRIEGCSIDSLTQFLSCQIQCNTQQTLQEFPFSQIGLSRRRVEQKFLTHTGVSMGKYLSISRFEKALVELECLQEPSLTKLGMSLGYYDQSHFVRTFKSYSGLTPKQFVHQYSSITEESVRALLLM